jgi:UDP-N-acetylmuramyl pentapeptide phosphotransferase/UDP-N-acetylglucosamine-1-phosphate transferase
MCFVAPAIAFFLLDARVTDLDIPGSTALLGFPLFSFIFTVFAVGGFAHALNIVDGFNGLSAMVVIVTLTALEVVALQVGDLEIALTAVIVAASVFGFFVWNYPRGLLFAGDGGAYLLGFLTAELAVLLVQRNSEVSPWFPLVVLLYPVVETLFSIYRKKILRGQSPGTPDGVHLHMLIYKRLVRQASASEPKWRMNSRTSPYLGALAVLAAAPAVFFWDDSRLLVLASLLFTLLYVWLYWRIVRFRTPRMLARRRGARDRADVDLAAPRDIESTRDAEQLSS